MALNPIRPTDDTARALAKNLLRTARSGSLATLSADGFPLASLVLIATDTDGTPLTLVSSLSAHSRNMSQDDRVSVLLAKTGKGDPLAHPRLSLQCHVSRLDRMSEEGQRARRRILARHPQSELYIDFQDFSLVALEIAHGSLNGGFGKAYDLERTDILLETTHIAGVTANETEFLKSVNKEHSETIELLATQLLGGPAGRWRMSGVDPEGCDLLNKGSALRLAFAQRIETEEALRATLASLARKARGN
jgi:hypothetical protein